MSRRIRAAAKPPEVTPMTDVTITIRIRHPTNGDAGYILASASYSQGGGNDLADGPANSDTLSRLTRDIEAVIAGFPKASFMDASE